MREDALATQSVFPVKTALLSTWADTRRAVNVGAEGPILNYI